MEMPRWWYRASMRLRALFRGAALDREFDEEIQYHIERLIETNLARGMSRDAARRDALLAIGGIEQRKEESRDTRRVRFAHDLLQDVRYAMRTLRRVPAFTSASILTLTVGIGTTVAMFTVVHGVLLRPLPFPEPDRLYLVSVSPKRILMPQPGMVDRQYLWFRTHDRTFEHLAAFTSYRGNLVDGGEPAAITVGSVGVDFFEALAVDAAIGRTFVREDEHDAPVLVIGHRLWRSRYAANAAIVGSRVTLDGVRRTVVGVMPDGFDFPSKAAAWTPQRIKLESGNAMFFPVLGRLRRGVTITQARAELDMLVGSLPDPPNPAEWNIGLVPLKELLVGNVRRPLNVFAGAVLLVLLIACANVANLLLAHASGRQREIAVRAALGAGRMRLARQLITESLVLSVAGAVLGVLFARWTVPALLALAPAGRIPRTEMIRIDGGVLAFAIAVAAITGVIVALAPALRITRERFARALLPGGRSFMSGQERFRATLVVAEIAVALVLLAGAGLMAKSFLRLRAVDPGFRTENVVRLSVELPGSKYSSVERLHAFHQEMLDRLSNVPNVVAAGMVNWLPLGDLYIFGDFTVEGAPAPDFNVDKPAVSADYFRVMGIRVLRGREFNEQDTTSSLPVAIVSRTVARALDASEDVIGRRLSLSSRPTAADWLTVVGVVDDVKQLGLSQASHAAIYQPYAQVSRPFFLSQATYVVRTNGAPLSVIPALRTVLRAVDRDQPATSIGLMSDSLSQSTAEPAFYTRLLGTFALVAVLLALIGTYGVIAYSVAQRGHEIGVRMALGARGSALLWMVMRRTLLLAVTGVGIGIVIAAGVTRLLSSVLFETTATDPQTFTVVAVTILAAACMAGLIPARRATRVDPVMALRHE